MILKNKNVLITGTNRGIGKACVVEFAKNGANIWAHARKKNDDFETFLQETAQKNNVLIEPLYFDVTDYSAIKEAVMNIKKSNRSLDALVNNAGITLNSLFLMSGETALREQFEVNCFSVFMFTQYASKLMVRNGGGSIVNISSMSAMGKDIGRSVYGASKAAVNAFSIAAAKELGEKGVRINVVAPGFIETDMMNLMTDDVIDANLQKSALKRIGQPSDVAKTAVFLASDEASYITGQVINVDGGIS